MEETEEESTANITTMDRTVLVHGLTEKTNKVLLELYFKNPKYGGGEIECIEMDGPKTAKIVFKEAIVAETVLRRERHSVFGHDVLVMPASSEVITPVRAIVVEGLGPHLGKDILEAFFESKKHSGGGEVEKIEMYEKSNRAIVWFVNTEDAQRVMSKGRLLFLENDLTISPYHEKPMVQISGISKKLFQEALEACFANRKMSGGGDIEHIDWAPEMKIAILTFKNQEDADRVVKRHEFSFGGCTLTASMYQGLEPEKSTGDKAENLQQQQQQQQQQRDTEGSASDDNNSSDDTSSSDEEEAQSCTIVVGDVKTQTSKDTVQTFFSSRGKSGGGKIESISYDSNNEKYLITFMDREAVDRVLMKKRHLLDGARLDVTEMRAATMEAAATTGPFQEKEVYIHGLSENISQLDLYMEEYTGCEVEEIVYGLDPSVALVRFKEKPNYKKLRKALARKPVEGCMLSMERVRCCESIQVFNCGHLSEEGLSAYFGSKKSGGSGDPQVKIHKDEECAIVTFDNSEVLENVLEKTDHRFDGQTLKLIRHYDRLGVTPSDHDTSEPFIQTPKELLIENLDENFVSYLKMRPKAQKHMDEEILGALRAKMDWNHDTETEIRILCTLQKEDKDASSLRKEWGVRVKRAVQQYESTVKIEERKCLPNLWNDIRKELYKTQTDNEEAAVILKDDKNTICVVGPADGVNRTYHEVDKICAEMEQKMQNTKETYPLQTLEKAILEKMNFLTDLATDYPKLNTLLTHDQLHLEGPTTDVINAQKMLGYFFRNMKERNLKLSRGKLNFLTVLQEQPNNELDKSLKQLTVVMQIEKDKVVLFGKNEDIEKCEEILESGVKEMKFSVTEEEHTAMKDDSWHPLCASLKQQCNNMLLLKYNERSSEVNLVAMSQGFDMALEEVKRHIQNNAIKQDFLDLGAAHNAIIGRWMKNELQKIEKDFQGYSVKINPLQEKGFQISGTSNGLAAVKTRIQQLKTKVISDKHTVTTPGMSTYFTQQEGGRYFLKAQEENHHVIIQCKDPDVTETVQRKTLLHPPPTVKEIAEVVHPKQGGGHNQSTG